MGGSGVEEGSPGGDDVLCETPQSWGKARRGGRSKHPPRHLPSEKPTCVQSENFSRMFTPALFLTTKTSETLPSARSQGVSK